jgi:fucose permease
MVVVGLGLPDSVLGVAWPTMRGDLAVPLEGAGLIAIVLTVCSAVSSVSSAAVNRRLGTGPVVALSCLLTAAGLFGYSVAPSYAWVLLAAVPLGFGQGGVDSSLNAYVAANYESRHMNWLHASWGIGATIGPMVMTQVLVSGFLWRDGYRLIAVLQLSLGVLFLASLRLWRRADEIPAGAEAAESAGSAGAGGTELTPTGRPKISGLRRVEPWIQIAMYALYCAAEISVGIWTASLLVEGRRLAPGIAGVLAASYYGGITGGRILTGFVAGRIGNRGLVRLGLATAAAGLALLLARLPVPATFAGLVFLGLGFAPIFPSLMHETPRRFDRKTYRTVIGFQMAAANLGGSLLPGSVGLAAARFGLESLFPCVAFFVAALFVLSERLNRTT